MDLSQLMTLAVLDHLAAALDILKVVGEGLRVICVQLLGFVRGEGKLALTALARHRHCSHLSHAGLPL
jgi:hypothetical protein